MNASELEFFLRHVKDFGKVLSIDQLCQLRQHKVYIVNNKPSVHPGEHWFVIDLRKKSPYVFCSFGTKPSEYGLPQDWKYSKIKLQDNTSDTCGLYCLYYIINGKMNVFSKNTKKNDKIVISWFKKYVRTKLYKKV